jgi:hypothetical protein
MGCLGVRDGGNPSAIKHAVRVYLMFERLKRERTRKALDRCFCDILSNLPNLTNKRINLAIVGT